MNSDILQLVEQFSRAVDFQIVDATEQFKYEGLQHFYTKSHQYKVAHFSVHIAEKLGLNKDQIFDLFLLGLLHDIGFVSNELSKNFEHHLVLKVEESIVNHCLIDKDVLSTLPFKTNIKNVIIYHHEFYDGSGFFGIQGNKIPLYDQIMIIPNEIDFLFGLEHLNERYDDIYKFVIEQSNHKFNPEIAKYALEVIEEHRFDSFELPCNGIPLSFEPMTWTDMEKTAKALMKIIDSKSKFTYLHSTSITEFVELLTKHYKFKDEHRIKMRIAANLHDVGKLYVPVVIIEKPDSLTNEEYEKIKMHPTLGYEMLQNIDELKEIGKWIHQHHETLDGSGYPSGLHASEIAFESQILSICDIFTALLEERPYRHKYNVKEASSILQNMAKEGKINQSIVNDLLFLMKKKMKKRFDQSGFFHY